MTRKIPIEGGNSTPVSVSDPQLDIALSALRDSLRGASDKTLTDIDAGIGGASAAAAGDTGASTTNGFLRWIRDWFVNRTGQKASAASLSTVSASDDPVVVATGAKADAAASDSTSAWSIVSLLKGLYALLSGQIMVRGQAAVGSAPNNYPIAVSGKDPSGNKQHLSLDAYNNLAVADQQARGWRDDGTESGLIRVAGVRGNLVALPFLSTTYVGTAAGSASVKIFTQPAPGENRDGVGTYLQAQVLSSASLANYVFVRFWITGNVFGLRYSAPPGPIGCMIDGIAYSLPVTTNIDPVSGASPGGAIYSGVEGYVLADDLGPGRHLVELSFPAFLSGSTRTYKIHGYLVDAAAGYTPSKSLVVGFNSGKTAITATTGGTAQKISVTGGYLGFRKLFIYNTTGSPITIYCVYATATSDVIWSRSVPANDTIEFDPAGTITDSDYVLFYASGSGLNVTPLSTVL